MGSSEVIDERALYPPIIKYLNQLGFQAVQEISTGRRFPDIEFWHNSEKFILEVEIGQMEKLLDGLLQAQNYASKVGTNNILVVAYPPEVRRPLIIPERLEAIALETPVAALIFTRNWKEHFIKDRCLPLKDLLSELKEKVEKREKLVSLSTVIDTLREGILALSELLRSLSEPQLRTLIDTVVGRFDLFLALGESTGAKKEELKLATIDLASYILINQILFYHIYEKLTGKVDPILDITDVGDLAPYFRQITDINYKAIYSIEVISKIPRIPEVNEIVRKVIKAIRLLEPESVKHDLLGRLFHELLPPKTRKILAAFYTRPVAAEILATLMIDRPEEKVIDLACGSGTLLVACYRRKLELLKKSGAKELNEMIAHTTFVEKDISGIDIMPFASHLTAINLASQNLNVTTNKVRVGSCDSLLLRPGQEIEPFYHLIQMKLEGEPEILERKEVVSPEGVGEKFTLEKVDCVIMNPPFTDKEKMPSDLKEKLRTHPEIQRLKKVCGGLINYWGYFVALADLFLNENGKIGLVIPISIFKGRDTFKLRKYLLDSYRIRYVVKAVKNFAFTERAEFRDILLIAEKRDPNSNDFAGIIFLKTDLNKLGIEEARRMAEEIRNVPLGVTKSADNYDIYWVSHDEMKRHLEHMMPIVAFQDVSSRETIVSFLEKCLDAREKLRKLKRDEIIEGFHTSPAGLSQITFVTRPVDESRVKKAFLVLKKEDEHKLCLSVGKGASEIIVSKDRFVPALRTGTGIKTVDIADKHDYIAVEEYEGYETVKLLSKWTKPVGWSSIKSEATDKKTYLAFIHRINPYSPNTHLLAFYSDKQFVPSDVLKKIDVENAEEAKILSIVLNTTFFLAQVFLFKEEATGTYPNVRTDDLINMYILNFHKLEKEEKEELLKLFEEIRHTEFAPSIEKQLKDRFWARVKMDKAILKILGFDEKEAESWLDKVYDALLKEMKDFKELCKA